MSPDETTPTDRVETTQSPIRLIDLQKDHIIQQRPGYGGNLAEFVALPEIAALGWPEEVVRQWLYDFLDRTEFLADYGTIDLRRIEWQLEDLKSETFQEMPTGPSDARYPEETVNQHNGRFIVQPQRVRDAWEGPGTWLVPPIVIDRALLEEPAKGLQVVEGRTRVAILRVRLRDALHVAPTHTAWVGRQATL